MHNFYTYCRSCFSDDDVFIRQISGGQSLQGQTYTYADLHHESGNIAAYLSLLGLNKGDRVIVQVEKCPQNLFWYFACLRAGLIYIPLNTAYKEQEIEYFLKDAKPALVLCDPGGLSMFEALISKNKMPCQVHCLDKEGTYTPPKNCQVDISATHGAADFTDLNCAKDDIAVILYTSGTTGQPKGAMITHGNLYANSTTLSKTWHWQHQDVMLHSLPIFHIHGLFVATHLPVINGSTIIFLEKFDPQEIIELLPEATVYMGVPTHYVRLLSNEYLTEAVCRNMRLFTSGSAPLLPQTFTEFQERSSHTIVERYGMTETGMNTSNPIEGERKAGTVGLALDGTKVCILDDAGEAVDAGTPGNLHVKGDNVFKGYWQMPEKTAAEFNQNGYFKTGDIASLDQDGYFSIIGRDKDMIITGGLNVYPKELELIIDDIQGVLESAVIGVPHPDFGEAVTAIVVKESGKESGKQDTGDELTEQDIISYLKERVANFKVAKKVTFVDALPRNTMGKVQKVLLRKMFN